MPVELIRVKSLVLHLSGRFKELRLHYIIAFEIVRMEMTAQFHYMFPNQLFKCVRTNSSLE